MIQRIPALAVATLVVLALACASAPVISAGDVPRMTKEDLKARLGDPNVTILDVRAGGDWTESARKIKGAVRVEPREVDSWAASYPKDRTLVLYCS